MHPSSPNARLATGRDRDHCRAAIKTGSRSFYAASLVLPAKVREPAYGLYAFCRLSDDAIDLGGGSLAALDRLRERLERAYCGRPMDHAADRAFADFLWRFSVPRALPEALLEGLAWDAEGRRYETLEDLHAYAARVAGAVGAMDTTLGQTPGGRLLPSASHQKQQRHHQHHQQHQQQQQQQQQHQQHQHHHHQRRRRHQQQQQPQPQPPQPQRRRR